VSALRLLRGVLLGTHLIAIANAHSSAHAEALAHEVPADRLAPILDVERLPETTADGRKISRTPAHHLQNCLRKRIDRGEIPPPDTVGVSMAMLMRVAGMLAELNKFDLGAWASLTSLSEKCDASPSQIRAVHNYLVQHGHSLRLSRLKADDRKVGGAKRPIVMTRTTIRPVFAITCDMIETLTEEQVLDLIALGEKRPRATEPTGRHGDAGERDVEEPTARHDDHGERAAQAEDVPAGGEAAADVAQKFVCDLAPEHRCLVEPLAALSLFTGISLPSGSVEWVADEADRAGLVDLDNVDLSHAAEALNELHANLVTKRRGAEAMGDPPPKIRGGRAGLQALIIAYLKGKRTWLDKNGDVYEARDAARALEEAHEALLTPEQRERRGLPPLIDRGRGTHIAAAAGTPQPDRPAPQNAPPSTASASTRHEQAVNDLHGRIALLRVRSLAEANAAKKAGLEAERADAERRLAELLQHGPPK
jgi:hypothetical protein